MAPIADERLEPVAAVERARKITPATIRVVDVPGTGAAAARQPAAGRRAARGRRRPDDEVEELQLELLVADRDHVERRLERVRAAGEVGRPEAAQGGRPSSSELLAHVDGGGTVADYAERAAAGARPADDEAAGRRVVNGHRAGDRPRRWRRSWPSSTTRRRRRSAKAASRRWTRSPAAEGRARPGHVLHRRRQGDARLDAPARPDRPRRRRDDPLRHRPRLHPLRGDRLAGPGRVRLARGGVEARPSAPRGQGVRRPGRRRAQHPLQRLDRARRSSDRRARPIRRPPHADAPRCTASAARAARPARGSRRTPGRATASTATMLISPFVVATAKSSVAPTSSSPIAIEHGPHPGPAAAGPQSQAPAARTSSEEAIRRMKRRPVRVVGGSPTASATWRGAEGDGGEQGEASAGREPAPRARRTRLPAGEGDTDERHADAHELDRARSLAAREADRERDQRGTSR